MSRENKRAAIGTTLASMTQVSRAFYDLYPQFFD